MNTAAVFGHYIDIYDIRRSDEDGATVPIRYESRLARIELPDEAKPRVDAEALVGAENRLRMVADDLVAHFEGWVLAMDGKAMVICMSRRACVDLYNQIVALRPDWHSDEGSAGLMKIVMTGSASDPEAW